jgi:hypothetical protein
MLNVHVFNPDSILTCILIRCTTELVSWKMECICLSVILHVPLGTNKLIYIRRCPLSEVCLIYTFLEFSVQLSSLDYWVILTYLHCLSLVRCMCIVVGPISFVMSVRLSASACELNCAMTRPGNLCVIHEISIQPGFHMDVLDTIFVVSGVSNISNLKKSQIELHRLMSFLQYHISTIHFTSWNSPRISDYTKLVAL